MDNVLPIEQVFQNRLFRVPDYQRGYAWDDQQVNDFTEDIEFLGPGKQHFTGTIALYDTGATTKDNGMTTYRVNDIVDGQQRLTTIVILLDVLRRAMQAAHMPEENSRGIRKAYIDTTGLDGQPVYKLKLNSDCNTYFRESILAESPGIAGPSIYSHERLLNTKAKLQDYVEAHRNGNVEEFREWLLDLCDKLTDRLVVCLYEIGDAAEVGVIFETMNDRGKPVSELEKVKNYLLYLGSKLNVDNATLTDRVNSAWSGVFSNLMDAGLVTVSHEEQLLRTHWLMGYDPNVRKWKGCRSVKDRFSLRAYGGQHTELVREVIGYADLLKNASVAYRDAANPDHQSAFLGYADAGARGGIVKWSRKLERLNVLASFLPLLGATRLRFPAAPEKYLRVVQCCEVFAFRVYSLLGRRSDAGQSHLHELAYNLFTQEISYQDALVKLAEHLFQYCTEKQFTEAFEFDPDFNWYEWSALKYFLYEYEDHLASRSSHDVEVAWQVVQQKDRADTIEHIYPITADHQYWQDRFRPEDRSRFLHDIGNLTLSTQGDNSSLSNDSFPDKKGQPGEDHRYIASDFRVARELCEYDEWTPESVQERHQVIVSWAKERWGAERLRTLFGIPDSRDTQEEDADE